MTTTAVNPIINKPREAPTRHWARGSSQNIVGADRPEPGRLPAHGRLPTVTGAKLRNKPAVLATRAGAANLLEMVNDTRAAVADWQAAAFPHTTRVTRDLLSHWTEMHPHRGLYFAQREAILTAIWLTEAAPHTNAGRSVAEELAAVNKEFNEGIPRICCQMATGTGKTAVMAALMLWQTCNHRANPDDPRFTNRFLAITPGITVRERLESGLQYRKHGLADELTEFLNPNLNLTPNAYLDDLNHIRFRTVNYHQFLPQDLSNQLFANNQSVGRVKTFARLPSQLENPEQIIARVLGHDARPVMIINDEAHHCHWGDPAKPETDAQETKWFNALEWLHRRGLAHGYVYDLSATPSFISVRHSPLFPWIVSQYNLQEAEEAGIVKIMRLPSASLPSDWSDEKAKNIYSHTPVPERNLTREDADRNSRDLKTALSAMYDDWNSLRQSEEWRQQPTPPVLAVVANSVSNADKLYDYIAGWDDGKEKRQGQVGIELSNISPALQPFTYPRTIVVHTKLDNPNASETGEEKSYLTRQAGIFQELYPDSRTAANTPLRHAPDKDVIRTVLNTIGKPGQPGEMVRCVISVGMLTEGWDTRTVTHIIGFRQFGTQLLCEQVSGRALRRVAQDADQDGYLHPEYADILGIPFANLGRKQGDGPGPDEPPPPHYAVKTVPERHKDFAIAWPNITGYRRRQEADTLTMRPPADWNGIEAHIVPEHGDALISTASQSLTGEVNELDPQPATRQEFAFLTAKHAVDDLTEIEKENANGIIRNRRMFQDLLSITKQAMDAGRLKGPGDARRWPNRHTDEPRKAAKWLLKAVKTDEPPAAEPDIAAVTAEPIWMTTARMSEYKSNRRYRHITAKSEVNIAVCDSDWEAQVAEALDEHPGVSQWIRNERLGWTIPYRWDGMNRQYEPDFIAAAPLDDGRTLHIVLEVKGHEYPADAEKRRWTEEYWLPAVNSHPESGKSGPWAYGFIEGAPLNRNTNLTINRAIAEANAAPYGITV